MIWTMENGGISGSSGNVSIETRQERNPPAMLGERSFRRKPCQTNTTGERFLLSMPLDVRDEGTFVATFLRTVRAVKDGALFLILALFLGLRSRTLTTHRFLGLNRRTAALRLTTANFGFVVCYIDVRRKETNEFFSH